MYNGLNDIILRCMKMDEKILHETEFQFQSKEFAKHIRAFHRLSRRDKIFFTSILILMFIISLLVIIEDISHLKSVILGYGAVLLVFLVSSLTLPSLRAKLTLLKDPTLNKRLVKYTFYSKYISTVYVKNGERVQRKSEYTEFTHLIETPTCFYLIVKKQVLLSHVYAKPVIFIKKENCTPELIEFLQWLKSIM